MKGCNRVGSCAAAIAVTRVINRLREIIAIADASATHDAELMMPYGEYREKSRDADEFRLLQVLVRNVSRGRSRPPADGFTSGAWKASPNRDVVLVIRRTFTHPAISYP